MQAWFSNKPRILVYLQADTRTPERAVAMAATAGSQPVTSTSSSSTPAISKGCKLRATRDSKRCARASDWVIHS